MSRLSKKQSRRGTLRGRTTYTRYSDPREVEKLDQNTVYSDTGNFGSIDAGLYSAPAFPRATYPHHTTEYYSNRGQSNMHRVWSPNKSSQSKIARGDDGNRCHNVGQITESYTSEAQPQHTPRNSNFHYTMDAERSQHPDHFSRFGYANCENGYCYGHVGYGYIVAQNAEHYEPPDMAPAHLYPTEEDRWFPRALSQAYHDEKRWK